jgi:signal transduction histidine kinase
MVADITRMDAMISQVLAFVRGEQMREPRGKLDLAELLRSCAADAPPESVDIRLAEADALEVCGEALNLRRALHNVIDNAVKYGRHAQVTLSREGRYACITIDDAGPGLPEEEFERVFEPFHRLEPSRNPETGGVGLGLALARAVVRAHDGAIRLSNRREGGLRVRVALPLAA